jgi:membrane-bound lytic murein transglycosylase D
MLKRLLSFVVLMLFSLSMWGQITASMPQTQENTAGKNYFPADDLDAIDSLALVEQGLPTAFMIDPSIVSNRLASLQNVIPLNYNFQTHQFVEYFAFRKAEFTQRMLEKRDLYFPLYEKYLKQYNLPEELKYLSLIESGLEPRALSNKGAGGLWQFMPYTARGDFGLRVDGVVDERFDPEKATEAACKYLKQLYRVFGDWHLALAAYNTGPGNVKRAIRKCGKSDFWGIYNCLPKQTRAYVPQFIAMDYMMNYHYDHAIHAEKWVKKIPFDTIQVKGYMNLNRLKQFASIHVDTFQFINPHLIGSAIPNDNKTVIVHIPSSRFAYFKSNRKAILDSASFISQKQSDSLAAMFVDKLVKRRYKVKRGQTIYDVARLLQVSVLELKHLNHLKTNRIKRGKQLVYFARIREKVMSFTEDTTVLADEPKGRIKVKKAKIRYHKVRSGDTLSDIAERYQGLTVTKLKKLNRMRASTTLRPGMRLRIS